MSDPLGVPELSGAPTPLPSVSVVIPTHNRRDHIVELVPVVLDDQGAAEVVVVADACTDGTTAALRQMSVAATRLRFVEVEFRNQFLSLQAGVEAASGDVVLQLDDDVRPGANLVTGHARHHATRDDLVVVGYMPTVLRRPRRPGQFATYLYAKEYERQCTLYDHDDQSILADLWAGNVSIRREAALRIGLTEPDSTMGHMSHMADREFGLRCKKSGLQGVFDRSLAAEHHHSRSLPDCLEAARSRGVDLVYLHNRHADLIGVVALDQLGAHLPAPGRLAVRLAWHRPIRRVELRLLPMITVVAGRLHWWRAESLAANTAVAITELGAIAELGAISNSSVA